MAFCVNLKIGTIPSFPGGTTEVLVAGPGPGVSNYGSSDSERLNLQPEAASASVPSVQPGRGASPLAGAFVGMRIQPTGISGWLHMRQ
jgi:hypothetical protein